MPRPYEMPKPRTNAPPSPPATPAYRDRFAWLTRLAFLLAVAVVCARAMMSEAIRDIAVPQPGFEAAPRIAGPATSLFLDLLLCIPALLVLLRRVLDNQYILRFAPSHVLMGALALWTLASIAWATDRFATLVASINFAAALALLWAMTQLVRSPLRMRLVTAAVVGLLLVHIAHGINRRIEQAEQVRQWKDPTSPNSRVAYMLKNRLNPDDFAFTQFERKLLSGELAGFSNSPNTYAAILVLMAVVTLGVIAQRLADRAALLPTMLLAAILAGCTYVLLHTHSRIAFVTPLLAIAILLILWRFHPWITARSRALYFAAVIAFFLAVAAVVGHGLYHGELPDKSLTYRWYYWSGAAKIVQQHPLLGVGWQNFALFYPEVRSPLAVEEVKDPHNFLVRSFAELGMIGGLLMIAWMLRLWWELTRPIAPPAQEPPTQAQALAWLAGLPLLAAALNAILSIDWDYPNTSWVFLQAMASAAFALLLTIGIAVAGMQSLRPVAIDVRPAPWILRGLLISAGIFLLHNLIDFSLFEPGPMGVFAMITGAALGARQPSAAGQRKRTPLAIAAFSAAVVAWVVIALIAWLPTMLAEMSAARGDQLIASAAPTPGLPPDPASLDAALQRYRSATKSQSLNGDYAFRAALAIMHADGAPGAIRAHLDSAIAANPRESAYHVTRATFELRQPNPDAEIIRRAFQRALELNPRKISLRLEYAQALRQLGDTAAAIDQEQLALRHDAELPPDEPRRLSPARRAAIEKRLQP